MSGKTLSAPPTSPKIRFPTYIKVDIGVISYESGKGEILRQAQTLKHEVSVGKLWNMLINVFNQECGVPKTKVERTREFFRTVYNLKKKLIWNQLVEGYHQGYVDSYVELTENEKNLIRAFHGKVLPVVNKTSEEALQEVFLQHRLDEYTEGESDRAVAEMGEDSR